MKHFVDMPHIILYSDPAITLTITGEEALALVTSEDPKLQALKARLLSESTRLGEETR